MAASRSMPFDAEQLGRCETKGRQGWMKATGALMGLPRELRNTMHLI